ncbi:hypothetical protein HK105_208710 [Polyrhizophydium stewartii]|uniref:Transmembrane protein n=1 Tax=Polyrhizophydium stewartii TaxID=2732419 RepID=A0ABR4MWX7_9FUNG
MLGASTFPAVEQYDNKIRAFTLYETIALRQRLNDLVVAITAALALITLVFRSPGLKSRALVAKMPLIASLLWFATTLLVFHLESSVTDLRSRYTMFYLIWSIDFAARSVLLWFTSARLRAVWQEARWIRILVVVLQLFLVAAVLIVIYASSPISGAPYQSQKYFDLIASYLVLDVSITVLDVIVFFRLWFLNTCVAQLNVVMVKPEFLYKALACVCVMISVPVITTVLILIGRDTLWTFYYVLYSFRTVITDLFSSAMRDSLVEQMSLSLKDMSTVDCGGARAEVQPSPPSPPAVRPRRESRNET